MLSNDPHVGSPRSRVDGPAKVTGRASYAAEFKATGLTHGYILSSAIPRGRIRAFDLAAALAVPGVLQIFTHENRPQTAWFASSYRDQVAPPGKPLRPLYDAEIQHSDQPIALVVASTFEAARDAASLIGVTYERAPHETDLERARHDSYEPPKKRSGIAPPPDPKGDATAAFGGAPIKVSAEYSLATEHHNPMELHGTTVVWESGGKITVHDKTQGTLNTQGYVTSVFGLSSDDVRVVSPFVGGGFGSALRPHHQLFLAVMASLVLERSVRVEMTRTQMFSHVHRPQTINTVAISADPDGHILSLQHNAVAATSRYEDYQENVVNWSGMLYHSEATQLGYELAKLDIPTPGDMRAPGAPTGLFALESAMDELAHATGIDPIELRLRNYTERDENDDKPLTSKELRACYAEGAARFGWSRRKMTPRSMRAGKELVGWGMASGVWEAMMMKSSARATLGRDGRLEIACAASDIGTGTYTILSQIGADALGLELDAVTVKLGDSSLPMAPIQGGSWTAASSGSAVTLTCRSLCETLLKHAKAVEGSPLTEAAIEDVAFNGGMIRLRREPDRAVSITDALAAAGLDQIEAEETASPGLIAPMRRASYTHSAVFAEVHVDEQLDIVRVTRVVSAIAAGRILNPKTARSQIIGGVVWGIGMALHEETMTDHRFGRFMNSNLGEYHVPVNADIDGIEVIFVEEHDDKVNPIGVKGLGEIGVVGTAAAIANAIHHATGKRIRSLPITVDKLLAA
ncbi:xanthine dehydrogenase family protein molybdopterin-binding subunit [Bosea sp. BK604]|uniref:xanthine dehydrogenase family protein molybdopterin-binding subunit n=1 Tax=Bosea sp. BK604 TaxID=2512180 RepID=UPI00104C6630|nr:xanthine dehydrogenase family protein molybdopterin-binding subunit [Bosea sp. BK604]TCR65705.1 xanthine dehydrogenase YagR molybdenum-binding subunit [Bosea sp. BK604]